MRAAACLWVLALAVGGCGEDRPAPAPDISPEPPPAAAEPEPEPEAPWAVRTIRTCSTWSASTLLATDRHLFACDGAVFDATTARLLRGGFDVQRRLATRGDRSAWAEFDSNAIVLRDGSLAERRLRVDDAWFDAAAFSPDGGRLALVDHEGLSFLDLTSGELTRPDESERCARAIGVGFDAAGRAQCVARRDEGAALVTLGRPDVPLDGAIGARWIPGREVVVVHLGESIRWLRADGEVLAERAATGRHALLDARADGSVLVSGDGDQRGTADEQVGQTERWWREGDAVHTEPLFERPAGRGAFVGDDVVIAVYEHVVWLHRGPPPALPTDPPEPPDGYTVLEASARSFADGSHERGPEDLVMFSSSRPGGSYMRVSRTDRDELSGFEDLDAWAAAAMSRYVEVGAERWAKAWTEPDGSRALRGHSYIGGCERTHIDVLVRERGEALERWVAMSAGGTEDGPFGDVPDDARPVNDDLAEGYAGDPSTGPI